MLLPIFQVRRAAFAAALHVFAHFWRCLCARLGRDGPAHLPGAPRSLRGGLSFMPVIGNASARARREMVLPIFQVRRAALTCWKGAPVHCWGVGFCCFFFQQGFCPICVFVLACRDCSNWWRVPGTLAMLWATLTQPAIANRCTRSPQTAATWRRRRARWCGTTATQTPTLATGR